MPHSAPACLITAAVLVMAAQDRSGTAGTRSTSAPVCAGVTVLSPADYRDRICAVLARAGADAALVDVVIVAPADGAGMRQPVNPEGGALNCGEAPRGERTITVRDHPACGLALWVERYVAHELGHRRWEALYPGEPYGPRWQAEEAYADGYADGTGWRW